MSPSAEVVAIDVLIEPGRELARLATALNARLRVDHPQGLALDATHVPHVSILQCYVHGADLPALEAALVPILSQPGLRQSGLQVTGREVSDWQGETSVVILIRRTGALQALQQAVAQAVAPYRVASAGPEAFVRSPGPPDIDRSTIDYVAGFVPARMGEHWSPHVTIGTASATTGAQLRGETLAPFAADIAGFAIYQLGNKGTARLRLWPR